MLARRRTISFNNGVTIDTPLLIPSFSSKGFGFYSEKGRSGPIRSDTSGYFEATAPLIQEAFLISAYDIFHGYLKSPLPHLRGKKLVFIDSGGYELSPEFDSTEPKQHSYTPLSFTETDYISVLDKFSKSLSLVITNYDHYDRKHGPTTHEQIIAAQTLFNKYPHFRNNFLIKPEPKRPYLDIANILSHASKMRNFDIIGVTEKELGDSPLERLVAIAELRNGFDRIHLGAPIHVWGGLDPIVTPLYFAAGAEIFDGVSWLRYGYAMHSAIPKDAYTVLTLGVNTKSNVALAKRMAGNLTFLEKLTFDLRDCVDKNFTTLSSLGVHGEALQTAYTVLGTKVAEAKGVHDGRQRK